MILHRRVTGATVTLETFLSGPRPPGGNGGMDNSNPSNPPRSFIGAAVTVRCALDPRDVLGMNGPTDRHGRITSTGTFVALGARSQDGSGHPGVNLVLDPDAAAAFGAHLISAANSALSNRDAGHDCGGPDGDGDGDGDTPGPHPARLAVAPFTEDDITHFLRSVPTADPNTYPESEAM